jgi:hypothetical protein
MINNYTGNSMRLQKHLLSPTALNPEDFAENLELVEEICRTLRALREAKDNTQIVIFLMRITGTPLDKIMSTTDLGQNAIEQRLRNLCELVALLDSTRISSSDQLR